jgi:hypothetical protein
VRTVIVSPTGGSATANGTLLSNALSGISGASSSNPYLLLIEPGVYDIGANTLADSSYIDIQGSGQDVTTVEAESSDAISLPDNSELSDLAVENAESSGGPVAITVTGGSPRILDVTATATGAASSAIGIGVDSGASPTLLDVTASATDTTTGVPFGLDAGGDSTVLIRGGSFKAASDSANSGAITTFNTAVVDIREANLSATSTSALSTALGLQGSSGAPASTVRDSVLGASNSIYVPSGNTLNVGGTEVDGSVIATGTLHCVDSWNASFAALGTGCT